MSRHDESSGLNGHRWLRGDQEIAARIERDELSGLFRRDLEVQPGTRMLLFEGGRYVGALPPGCHRLDGVRRSLGLRGDGDATAIVVDDGEISADLHGGGLRSVDRYRVGLAGQVAFRVTDPELFVANLVRDRRRFEVSDVATFLADEARDAAGRVAIRHEAADLHTGNVRDELELELMSCFRPTFDRLGLTLLRFRVLRFEVPVLNAAIEIEDQARLEKLRLEHELDGRRRVFDREAAEQERRLDVEQLRRRGVSDVQLDKIRGLEAVRQQAKDREASRLRQHLAEDGEAFSEMSTEQILAMAVARKPESAHEVAEALRAVRDGDPSRRERELYERLLDEVRSNYERSQRLDHDKFIAGFQAGAGGAPMQRCATHQIRYAAAEGCPLCAVRMPG